MAKLSDITTAEPHFVPGYTGYCPQYRFRIGDTYGVLTHKLLTDPCTNHSEYIILPTEASCKEIIQRPTLEEINLVKTHEKSGDPIYKYPIIPGYCGFVPFSNENIGARYSIITTEGVAKFEKYMTKKDLEYKILKHRLALQSGNVFPKSLAEKSLNEGEYRLPLIPVTKAARAFTTEDNLNGKYSKTLPYSKHTPPHFMELDDPRKFIISGYAGWIPFQWTKIGKRDNSALCDFFKHYHYKRCNEFTPITNYNVRKFDDNDEKCEIYIKDENMIPNYTGHVPGIRFEIGKTYGKSTINAKEKLIKI